MIANLEMWEDLDAQQPIDMILIFGLENAPCWWKWWGLRGRCKKVFGFSSKKARSCNGKRSPSDPGKNEKIHSLFLLLHQDTHTLLIKVSFAQNSSCFAMAHKSNALHRSARQGEGTGNARRPRGKLTHRRSMDMKDPLAL
jgi:hypothetical protein